MWAQGLFRSRGTTEQWGLDFIAQNLLSPTTCLHYPTMERFIAEVKRGYDYVGIAFVSSTFHKMVPMVEAVRKHAPDSKIILGGYGTALGDMLEPYADHICKGEGIQFMRELLGEPTQRPIKQPVILQSQALFSLPLLEKTGYVIAGLGCPNGCDFCVTSHYFKRRHIRFLPDGESILSAIEDLRRASPGLGSFWINDEDFLLDEKRGRGFLEAVRASDLPPISLSVFSSVKALSQFKASELVEMGVDWVWVGYEGHRAGYSKMKGRRYEDLFADLHRHGISVMASMIIGFDYQTPEIIQEEFDELMRLRPTMCQFLIYGAAHGTPAYERLAAEGRLVEEVYADHSKHDGFSLGFVHPHIEAEEMERIQRELYHEEFRRLGPSVLRVAEDWLSGAENLQDHPRPRVRAKARKYKQLSHRGALIVKASKRYVNEEVGRWLDSFYQRLIDTTGPLTPSERVVESLSPLILAVTDWKLKHQVGQQPRFTRRTYNTPPPRGIKERIQELPNTLHDLKHKATSKEPLLSLSLLLGRA
jgi:haloalkane dehalogenase